MGKHPPMTAASFRHEATFYDGPRGFAEKIVPMIADELAGGANVLVMADTGQTAMIRSMLGARAASLRFADVDAKWTNPARLIPRWSDFVGGANGRPLLGVGALRYARTPAEESEFELHEALLNVAFTDGIPWRLVCPFDTSTMPNVVREAQRTHPSLLDGQRISASPSYLGLGAVALTLSEPLPKPPQGAADHSFERADLADLRSFLREQVGDTSLSSQRKEDLLLAAHEAATNCLRHGGGAGSIRVWREDSRLVVEVVGNGRITDPLVGRRKPDPRRGGGLGLWIVNQVCDLVQLRSGPDGTVVRMYMLLPG